MTIAYWSTSVRSDRQALLWAGVALTEAAVAALTGALVAFGPFFQAPSRPLWLAGAAGLFALYLAVSLWSAGLLLAGGSKRGRGPDLALWVTTLPFLALFSASLGLLQFSPDIAADYWSLLSPIAPFNLLSNGIVLLLVFLLKALAVFLAAPGRGGLGATAVAGAADVAIPAAMLLIGVLQASVYLVPIGNAFLRFWAIADALPGGPGYPVTLTEPGPVQAGSPLYVYDLPLFPLMLAGAFGILGHNGAAAHLPAALWNALFPLSLYLLIREATGSRVVAVVFSALASLFPYLRFWVLNLPDPDPFLLTTLCFAGYLYLRALAAPERRGRFAAAGLMAGILSLARPEGLLYSGCLALGVLVSRPGFRQMALYLAPLGLFVAPMAAVWRANFGFLWPQNYNRTLGLRYAGENYDILKGFDSLGFYRRGLGLDEGWALGLLLLFVLAVAGGTLLMARWDRRLLALAVPGIGNTVLIWFANPYIPNTFHFADFFRHASFGIPLLVLIAAYAFHRLYRSLAGRGRLRWASYLALLLLVAAVAREGHILANPTATHYPGATQALTTYTYLSMEGILAHPMPLPPMDYYRKDGMVIAKLASMPWPDPALEFYAPLDMSFDSNGRPFGYASVLATLLALGFALLAGDRALGGRLDREVAAQLHAIRA